MAQTRASLVVRLQAGDDAAWWELEHLFGNLIISYAHKSGCPATMVDEVYQITMIQLARSVPKLDREKGRLRDYILGITRHVISAQWTRYYRQQGGRDAGRPITDQLDQLPAQQDLSADAEDSLWLAAIVSEALQRTFDRIEDITYKSFCMNLLEGRQVPEIMDALDLERSEVDNHKNRCLDMLCQDLQSVIAELDDKGLPDFLVGGRRSRAKLKHALNDYLDSRDELRRTCGSTVVSQDAMAQTHQLTHILRRTPPPETDRPLLLILQPEPATWLPVSSDDFTIGRHPKNHYRLDHESVSGRHAHIHLSDGAWSITDRASRNGTRRNGDRITSCTIQTGDIIYLGKAKLIFLDAQASTGY